MSDKYNVFLEITSYLNNKMGITPLLFGSLGLEKRLNMDLQAEDIDVLIPEMNLLLIGTNSEKRSKA